MRYPQAAGGVCSVMGRLLVVLEVATLLASACTRPGNAVQIDWVDFVVVGSIEYVAGPQPEITLQEADLGPIYARVKFKVEGNISDPNYRPKDGDAAYLDPGTPIYAVNGRSSLQVVAAHENGGVVAYRALRTTP